MTLDDILAEYSALGRSEFYLLMGGLYLLGAMASLGKRPPRRPQTRGHFLCYLMAFYLGFPKAPLFYDDVLFGLTRGMVGLTPDLALILMVLECGIVVLSGFFLFWFGRSRSEHAFGHAGWGWVALVPILNIWFMYAPPRPETEVWGPEDERDVRLTLRVFGAVFVLVPALMWAVLVWDFDPHDVRWQNTVRETQGLIRAKGMAQALADIAAGTTVPAPVDDRVTLVAVDTSDVRITKRYRFDVTLMTFDDLYKNDLARRICDDPVFYAILGKGGVIEYQLFTSNLQFSAEVVVTLDHCTF